MTRDRVYRFLPTFDSPDDASRFADHQARAWLLEQSTDAEPTNIIKE